MSCPAPTLCGPRTFWAFQKMACNGTANYCGSLIDCAPHDILRSPNGAMATEGWIRSVIYMLLGSDAAYECQDLTRRRRGNPADAFRSSPKHGNRLHRGYKGTTQQQLSAMAADLQGQIAGFLDWSGISASVSVKATFAGAGQAQLNFTIGQKTIAVGVKPGPDRLAFVWGNI